MLITVREYAQLTQTPRDEVYALIRAGRIWPTYHLGERMTRIPHTKLPGRLQDDAALLRALPITSLQPGRYLTALTCARYLAVSRKRVYQLIAERKLAAVRFGPRQTRILSDELLDYCAASIIDPHK